MDPVALLARAELFIGSVTAAGSSIAADQVAEAAEFASGACSMASCPLALSCART
jgi:hypothetical protein